MINIENIARGWRCCWQEQLIEISFGGSLLAWEYQGNPRLFVSPASKPELRLRGGLPVCWPWFGQSKEAGLPPHGFLQDRAFPPPVWHETDAGLTLTLRSSFHVDSSVAELTLQYLFSRNGELMIHCEVRNVTSATLTFDLGLHPYLALPEGAKKITLILGNEAIVLPRSIDDKRHYESPITVSINDNAWLLLTTEGFQEMGVWRIDEQKSREINDLPDNACNDFFCIEPLSRGVVLNAHQAASWQARLCWLLT